MQENLARNRSTGFTLLQADSTDQNIEPCKKIRYKTHFRHTIKQAKEYTRWPSNQKMITYKNTLCNFVVPYEGRLVQIPCMKVSCEQHMHLIIPCVYVSKGHYSVEKFDGELLETLQKLFVSLQVRFSLKFLKKYKGSIQIICEHFIPTYHLQDPIKQYFQDIQFPLLISDMILQIFNQQIDEKLLENTKELIL